MVERIPSVYFNYNSSIGIKSSELLPRSDNTSNMRTLAQAVKVSRQVGLPSMTSFNKGIFDTA